MPAHAREPHTRKHTHTHTHTHTHGGEHTPTHAYAYRNTHLCKIDKNTQTHTLIKKTRTQIQSPALTETQRATPDGLVYKSAPNHF